MIKPNRKVKNMTSLPVEDVHEQAGELSSPKESGNNNGAQEATSNQKDGVLPGPKLNLLDLPAEISKEIVMEVSVSFRDECFLWYGALNK